VGGDRRAILDYTGRAVETLGSLSNKVLRSWH
jgi:hypothetical protein